MHSCENNSIFQDQKHIEEWQCFALLPASLILALMEDRWILIAAPAFNLFITHHVAYGKLFYVLGGE